MSQHDYDLANAGGSAFRSDVNSALAAIVSLNSGSSAPSTTFAYMLWLDTTNGVLKQRNAANSAWITRHSAAESRVVAKSGAYTVVLADFLTTIVATGTWSLALTAAATLGDGFCFYLKNAGSGVITIDPSSSEQVDGATTVTVNAGQGCLVFCNGSAFYTIGLVASASESMIVVREEQTSGTNGGGFTSGAWQTRTLNTKSVDTAGIASLASSQITLPAGTWRITASAPAYACGSHQAKLYNVTDAADVILGTVEFASVGNLGYSRSIVEGRFTISGSKAFELRHRCTTTKSTDGFGIASSIGTEVYSIVHITKEQ